MNTKAKHTPGPFVINSQPGKLQIQAAGKPEVLAIVTSSEVGNRRYFDARLFSAAPDLLAALDAALPQIQYAAKSRFGNDTLNLVLAARAKARGE